MSIMLPLRIQTRMTHCSIIRHGRLNIAHWQLKLRDLIQQQTNNLRHARHWDRREHNNGFHVKWYRNAPIQYSYIYIHIYIYIYTYISYVYVFNFIMKGLKFLNRSTSSLIDTFLCRNYSELRNFVQEKVEFGSHF